MPHLRVLDYRRITERERAVARKAFESSGGRLSELAASLTRYKSPVVGAAANAARASSFDPGAPMPTAGRRLTAEERAAISDAIDQSQSMEEIRRLEEQLKLGYVPTK